MLRIKGEVGGEYFDIRCVACNDVVRLYDFRWVGHVPRVTATCCECEKTGDFKERTPTEIQQSALKRWLKTVGNRRRSEAPAPRRRTVPSRAP